MKTYSVDYAAVLDLPDDPTPDDIANAIAQHVTRCAAEGDISGCVTITETGD